MIAPLPAEATAPQSLAHRPVPDLSGVRIVVANWRDPWHPQAGGAERYAWEMARGLTARGGTVRFVTARAPGQARRECRDGIEIIRLGGQFTVYPLVAGWLLAHRRSIDVVLDCQNGIPFFTPLVMPRRVPVLCVMHHVHTAQFGVHFPAWMAWVGRLLEGPAARLAYRRQACVAVSPSTVAAMRERLRWTGDIYLIPNGAPVAPRLNGGHRAQATPAGDTAGPAPGLVWVGRLVAHKRAELIVPVAERGFTVEVIGRGPDAAALSAAIGSVPDLAGAVHLRGYLPEADKQAVVGQSLLHLNTSQGEGWGLCVLEAAALGVPTVAYDVEGLRDAVHDGQTGWLVREGQELADVVERAAAELADPGRRAQVAAACRDWAAQLTWERSTERMAGLVAACVRVRSSRGNRAGAWTVSRGDGAELVAEGPALDLLLADGATLGRPATWAERLLGKVNRGEGPGGSAEPP
ncbi:MAG TPA: glycosyltransferase family 4 protein [Streptosporangiaceae bacterium]|nr:glycosyltransferase family 4 protein [Streptosporangiaceae bacterium]